jgi:heptosyltransferase-2
MCAPTVGAVSEATPSATRIAFARPALVPLARMLPGVHEARPLPRRGAARALRAAGADAAVVFPRSLRAALAALRARIPVRVGFAGPLRGLTHAVEGWRPLRSGHRTRWYGLLTGPFGRPAPEDPPQLAAPPEALAGADHVLRELGRRRERRLVVLEAGAAYGTAKCWPAERYGDLARGLLAAGFDVATVGAAASLPVEERVAARAGPGILLAVGRTDDLASLVGILARASLVVSNDTGPMHLAAALGTPVLALFGASDPAVSAPLGRGTRRVIYDPEPCSPCFLRECAVPGHPCLVKVSAERVLREALAMLAS